jgi:protein phosphatase
VSVDHSEVQELIDAGLLDAQDAGDHPLRNVVTRALGSDPAPAADVWVFPPVAGDRLIVVSDGVTRELSDSVIASLLAENGDPQDAASAVVAAAGAAGGHDNASAVVVDLLAEEDVSDIDEDTEPRPGAR